MGKANGMKEQMKRNKYLIYALFLVLSLCLCACVADFAKKEEERTEQAESGKKKKKEKKKGKEKRKDKKREDQGNKGTGKGSEKEGKDEESFPEEKESAESKEEEPREILPPNSSQNEGNTMGNLLSYARMVRSGDVLYFRNPFDNERLYSLDASGRLELLMDQNFVKDMHVLGGCIYFANTSPGDVSGLVFEDRNLYCFDTAGGALKKLTNLHFQGEGAWLSFDAVCRNKAYFSYYDGSRPGYVIASVSLDTRKQEELAFIEADQTAGNPCLNIVENSLYYLDKSGLKCLDLNAKSTVLAVPGLRCENYLIYDGYMYYTSSEEGSGRASLHRAALSGEEDVILYGGGGAKDWVSSIQPNIYKNRLYFLAKSADERRGELYACALDGSGLEQISGRANWFNILDDRIYYRFTDYHDMEISRREPIYYVDLNRRNPAAKERGKKNTDSPEYEAHALFDSSVFNKDWVVMGNAWYCYDKNGNFLRNAWNETDGLWRYLGPDGRMMTDAWVEGKYYVGSDGVMMTDAWIEGRYYVGKDGVWVPR